MDTDERRAALKKAVGETLEKLSSALESKAQVVSDEDSSSDEKLEKEGMIFIPLYEFVREILVGRGSIVSVASGLED
jgi:hypothetical protein